MGEFPEPRRYVIFGGPHTSNWDFVLAMLAVRGYGIKISFIGKHTLFRKPFGFFFRWLGGIPIDRSKPGGLVEQTAVAFAAGGPLMLVIAPEGTRSRSEGWHSGFYHIARAADVPVVPAALDGGHRQIRVGEPIRLTGDIPADMDRIREWFADVRGVRPERQSPIRLREEG